MTDSENNGLAAGKAPAGERMGIPATRIAPILPRGSELAERAEQLRTELPTERMRRFVLEYLEPVKGKVDGKHAALRAGYPEGSARREATRLISRPDVKAAIKARQAWLAAASAYTTERCMAELERGMDFALRSENASAYVRAVELRAKLTGILVDRLDARIAVGTFTLNVSGLEAGDA